VLVQQHAGQRPARTFLAVRPPARGLGDQAGGLQPELGPGVAEPKAVVLAQLVVEVLGAEPAVALAIERQHRVHLVGRHASAGSRARMPRISAASAWLSRRCRQRP
jgi:hypothetical protein